MRKQTFKVCFVSICVLLLASSTVVSAEPIVLKWASMIPKNSPEAMNVQKLFIDKVNEQAKGELVIEYRGGPEAIPAINLGSAVKKGVVDIAEIITGFYEAIVPGVNALMLTEYTPQEEHQKGITEEIVKFHQKNGLMFLLRAAPSNEGAFVLYLNKKVEKPEDFPALRIGSGPAARAASLAWGAKVVPVKSVTEYYTSMERGLYDGMSSCPLVTWVALGCQEVTKYVVDHPYYQSTMMLIMNLDSWNKLSENLQNIMKQAAAEYATPAMQEQSRLNGIARKKSEEAGVEFYKFRPEVAAWFISTAYKAAWDSQQEKFPEVTPALKKLLSK